MIRVAIGCIFLSLFMIFAGERAPAITFAILGICASVAFLLDKRDKHATPPRS